MITRNFYKLYGIFPVMNMSGSKVKVIDGTIENLGALSNISTRAYDGNTNNIPSSAGHISLILGSGTEDESIENYTITPINDGIRVEGGVLTGNDTYEENQIILFTKTITNISNDDIVINECGVVSKYSSAKKAVLFSRTKFDEPIVIAPNETKTFTHKIEI